MPDEREGEADPDRCTDRSLGAVELREGRDEVERREEDEAEDEAEVEPLINRASASVHASTRRDEKAHSPFVERRNSKNNLHLESRECCWMSDAEARDVRARRATDGRKEDERDDQGPDALDRDGETCLGGLRRKNKVRSAMKNTGEAVPHCSPSC